MATERSLSPTRFHERLADTLEQSEPGLWRWLSSDVWSSKYAANVRLELLRSTYRLPPAGHEKVYALARAAANALEVTAPITLYQAHGEGTLNAGLVFVPDEAHVVLRGPVVTTLGEVELKALFGHELAHHRLWTERGGRFRVADALIEHIVAQRCAPSHEQSALKQRKWTELYADRGALLACEDLDAAIGCLLKMETGLHDADPRAWLAQAEEAIAAAPTTSKAHTHPESFIRAFALKAWHEGRGEREEVASLVEGPLELESLDLVQQKTLTEATRALLERVLAPPLMRTEATLAHARRFFADDAFTVKGDTEALPRSETLDEYYCYVLLDFAVVDPDLEDAALAHIAQVGRQLGLEQLPKLAKKELRVTAATWAALENLRPLGGEGATP